MDKKEAEYVDMWATKEHVQNGRIEPPKSIFHYNKVNWRDHMERLKPQYTKTSKFDTKQHKPKEKEYGKVDKTNLTEL